MNARPMPLESYRDGKNNNNVFEIEYGFSQQERFFENTKHQFFTRHFNRHYSKTFNL